MEEAPLPEILTLKPEEEKMTDIKEYKLFLDNQEIKTQIGLLENFLQNYLKSWNSIPGRHESGFLKC